MSRLVRLAAALLLACSGLLAFPERAAAADFHACVDAGNVWVVINFKGSISTGCAVSPSNGANALKQVATIETAKGMVSRINGNPATIHPDPYIYWNYFHKDPAGSGWGPWVYSDLGAGSYVPKKGSIEGWTYGATGTQMGWSPPARPAAPVTTQPAPQPGATTTAGRATARTRTTAPGQATTAPAATAPTTAAPTTAEPTTAPATEATPTASAEPTESATPSGTPTPDPSGTPTVSAPPVLADVERTGSPLAAIGTLAVVGAAAVGGGAWWFTHRRVT